jgi:hypothetical protein
MRGKSETTAPHRAAVKMGFVAAVGLTLAACGGAQTTVVAPTAQPVKVSAITLMEAKPTVSVPPEVMSELHEKLTAKLYKPGAFGKGSNVKLAYRVVDYSAGNESRWSFGSMTGQTKGSVTVEAVYLDKGGHELGKIRSEGKVGSSLLGKSMDDAVEHVADEVASYTTKTFK